MPAIIYALIAALGWAMSSFVGRVLVALGIQYITYKGVDKAFDWVLEQALASLSSMPAGIVQIVGMTRLDDALAIIAGAVFAKMFIKGFSADGSITRMVLK